ncbi:PDZ domain-containing protein [Branchiibius cervicis]|uniref:endopeptidase La n=1 Tax=Branchiibius cervicis TaxID=908252 RepID=A0ABW2APV2_9MICO
MTDDPGQQQPQDPASAVRADLQTTPPAPAPRRSPTKRTWILLILSALIVVGLSVASLIKVPVAILRPGPATDTLGTVDGKPVINIEGATTYPTDGQLLFTTVSLAGGPQYPVSAIEWAWTKLTDRDAQFYPESAFFQEGQTADEVQQESTAEMTGSQEIAQTVALRAAGFTVGEKIEVAAVASDAPSGKVFHVGDILVTINGKAIARIDDPINALDGVKAGATVPVTVERDGRSVSLEARTGARPDNGKAYLGIVPNPKYSFPVKVTVNAGDVGGPSAGTMFSLAIYDKLTSGSLTGGKSIAGTGTISEDGTVGPIGGVRQKMIGARDAGATYFLAPESDCGEVVGHVPAGLTVVRIATFDEARADVQKLAAGQSQGLPTCTAS